MRPSRSGLVLLCALLFGPVLTATPASAATITVNTTDDEFGTDPAECSLREAIHAHNSNGPISGCPAGSSFNNVIHLPPGRYALTIPGTGGDFAGNSNGSLGVTAGTVTIDGTGAADSDASAVVIDASPIGDRILETPGPNIVLRDLTLTGAQAPLSGVGGAIFASSGASVSLERVVVRGNRAVSGGGLSVAGPLTMDRVSIVSNTATSGSGGGVFLSGSATVSLINVTMSQNTATQGAGGFHVFPGPTVTIVNSTFASNTGGPSSGGIHGPATLQNSIVASNVPQNCGGAAKTSNGNNLDSGITCGFGSTGDVTGTDPKLDVLRDYGGGILTQAIKPNSPARNAGSNTGDPATDIRGVGRPQGGTTDIGSYESTGYVVTSTADTADVATNDSCDVGGGVCTLRAALEEANAQSGRLDHIGFNITGTGHVISPGSALPTATDPVVIDGTTEPEYLAGTKAITIDGTGAGGGVQGLSVSAGNSVVRGLAIGDFGGNGIILVTGGGNLVESNHVGVSATGTTAMANGNYGILATSNSIGNVIGGSASGAGNVVSANGNGGIASLDDDAGSNTIQGNIVGLGDDGLTALGNLQNGIDVFNDGNTLDGNVVAASQLDGINLSSADENLLTGNIVGLAADGATIRANHVGIDLSGNDNVIGGTSGVDLDGPCTGACNLISGNTTHGIALAGKDNSVLGNFIGTNDAGTGDRGNGLYGIRTGALDATGTTAIGGTTNAARNVIGGNGGAMSGAGIAIEDTNSRNVVVQGNYIGLGADGGTQLGNTNGVRINQGDANTLGGIGAGRANIIAYNAGDGVLLVLDAQQNSILGNAIFDNGDLAIDHNANGVTANDAAPDGDSGPNGLQNFPDLTGAGTGDGQGRIEGTLTSAPNTSYRVEVFSNALCDPSGNGEANGFLGSATVTTDGSGSAPILITIPFGLTLGGELAATATDLSSGATSELSQCAGVVTSLAMTNPTDRFTKAKAFPVGWTPHQPQGGETYDVRARSAPFNGGFGSPTPAASDISATSMTFTGSPGRTYCLAARAQEPDGDASAYAPEACTTVPLDDRAFSARRFSRKSASGYYLNTYSQARRRGATLTRTGVQGNDIALLAATCGRCGKVRVIFGGVSVATISLKGPSRRNVLFDLPDLPTLRTGTLTIKVLSRDKPVRIGGVGARRNP